MTTTARPAEGQPRGTTQRVLLLAGVCCLVVVAALSLAGALASGQPAAAGAAVGGGVALAFLLFGASAVAAATSVSPQTALLVAMTTFLFVVVLVAGTFYGLDASGVVGRDLTPGWVAGGVAATALTWTVALLVGHARSRVLAFDLPPQGVGATHEERSSGVSTERGERAPTPAEARAR